MGDPLFLAREHVIAGRKIVTRQRALIQQIKAQGRDAADAEGLLVCFETTLISFEDDLARLEERIKISDGGS